MGILVLYTSFLSPLDIAFEFEKSTLYDVYIGFDYLILTLFAFDILINFRSTYFDENLDEILAPKLIAKNYLKSYNFYVDVISTVPISEISQIFSDASVSNNYTRIFK